MSNNDVVLTGPPRCGTTLTCELLNEAADTVALDEPMDREMWPVRGRGRGSLSQRLRRKIASRPSEQERIDPKAFCDSIESFFDDTRRSLLAGEGAISLNYEGQVHGGKFPDAAGSSGLREDVTKRSVMPVNKPLTPDFVLVVKHISGFTAMLPALAERFRAYAVIRNPLSALSSWRTVSAPISSGRIPRGERIDHEFGASIAALTDVTDRQFAILRWFFERFSELPRTSLVRYEDIVATNGRVLASISPGAADIHRSLESRNTASIYDRDQLLRLGERLLTEEGPWWDHYTPDEVRGVMDAA